MSTDVATRTSAVDPVVAQAMQTYDRLQPLKNALGIDSLTDAEMQLFAMVANRTGLDPFTKQIYAIKRAGKVTHQTGIDGYRSVAEGTRQYAGSDEATFELCTCSEKPEGHPAVARVTVHRILPSGHVVDQVGVARWHELKPAPGQSGEGDAMWRRMPFNQLAKCAEANGLRKAFPRVLVDVYIEDEMAQAGPPQNGALTEAASKPDPRDRLAARRAAIEAESQATVIDGTATLVDELPAADSRPEPGDPGPVAPTPASPARAAAVPPAAVPGLTFEAFNAAVGESPIDREDIVEVCRVAFPTVKAISGMTDKQRGRLFVLSMERAEARMAAADASR